MATTPQSVGLVAGVLFFLMLIINPEPAAAFDPWTPRDTVLQGTVLTLMWIDYKQTLEIASGRHPEIVETNWALGKHPTRREVTRYFASTAAIHTALMPVLPEDWRIALQSGAIGVELCAVSGNYQLGLSVRF